LHTNYRLSELFSGQVKGDGEPTCFSHVNDTGIPALQKWCHTLTGSSRERAARSFLTHLKTFANSVRQYVECAGEVTEADRSALKDKWESEFEDTDADVEYDGFEDGSDGFEDDSDEDDPFQNIFRLDDNYRNAPPVRSKHIDSLAGRTLYTLPTNAPKVDAWGEPIGITPRLNKVGSSTVTSR
jgi:hypothetical protein